MGWEKAGESEERRSRKNARVAAELRPPLPSFEKGHAARISQLPSLGGMLFPGPPEFFRESEISHPWGRLNLAAFTCYVFGEKP